MLKYFRDRSGLVVVLWLICQPWAFAYNIQCTLLLETIGDNLADNPLTHALMDEVVARLNVLLAEAPPHLQKEVIAALNDPNYQYTSDEKAAAHFNNALKRYMFPIEEMKQPFAPLVLLEEVKHSFDMLPQSDNELAEAGRSMIRGLLPFTKWLESRAADEVFAVAQKVLADPAMKAEYARLVSEGVQLNSREQAALSRMVGNSAITGTMRMVDMFREKKMDLRLIPPNQKKELGLTDEELLAFSAKLHPYYWNNTWGNGLLDDKEAALRARKLRPYKSKILKENAFIAVTTSIALASAAYATYAIVNLINAFRALMH